MLTTVVDVDYVVAVFVAICCCVLFHLLSLPILNSICFACSGDNCMHLMQDVLTKTAWKPFLSWKFHELKSSGFLSLHVLRLWISINLQTQRNTGRVSSGDKNQVHYIFVSTKGLCMVFQVWCVIKPVSTNSNPAIPPKSGEPHFTSQKIDVRY